MDFWESYYQSITPKNNQITVRWDSCAVGCYGSVEEARGKLVDSSSYEIDKSDFWYQEPDSNEWKRLYDESIIS